MAMFDNYQENPNAQLSLPPSMQPKTGQRTQTTQPSQIKQIAQPAKPGILGTISSVIGNLGNSLSKFSPASTLASNPKQAIGDIINAVTHPSISSAANAASDVALPAAAKTAIGAAKFSVQHPQQALTNTENAIPAAAGVALPALVDVGSGGAAIPADAALAAVGSGGGTALRNLIQGRPITQDLVKNAAISGISQGVGEGVVAGGGALANAVNPADATAATEATQAAVPETPATAATQPLGSNMRASVRGILPEVQNGVAIGGPNADVQAQISQYADHVGLNGPPQSQLEQLATVTKDTNAQMDQALTNASTDPSKSISVTDAKKSISDALAAHPNNIGPNSGAFTQAEQTAHAYIDAAAKGGDTVTVQDLTNARQALDNEIKFASGKGVNATSADAMTNEGLKAARTAINNTIDKVAPEVGQLRQAQQYNSILEDALTKKASALSSQGGRASVGSTGTARFMPPGVQNLVSRGEDVVGRTLQNLATPFSSNGATNITRLLGGLTQGAVAGTAANAQNKSDQQGQQILEKGMPDLSQFDPRVKDLVQQAQANGHKISSATAGQLTSSQAIFHDLNNLANQVKTQGTGDSSLSSNSGAIAQEVQKALGITGSSKATTAHILSLLPQTGDNPVDAANKLIDLKNKIDEASLKLIQEDYNKANPNNIESLLGLPAQVGTGKTLSLPKKYLTGLQ